MPRHEFSSPVRTYEPATCHAVWRSSATDPAPAPRFYQVHFAEGEYFVSAALFEPNEHTLPIADEWHKYQIGSRPDPAMKIRAVGEVEGR